MRFQTPRARITLSAALLTAFVAAPAAAASGPAPCDPCELPDGGYAAAAPPDWNGRDSLKLLVFLHGWGGKATDITGDPHIARPAHAQGFLLVAPDGRGAAWNFRGLPDEPRDDVAFLHHVVADARSRWPIDPAAIVLGGFSIGGSMTWHLACYAPAPFTAFMPFSGGFWEKLPAACPGGPVNLRHTHGTHDSVVPMAGQAFDEEWKQADIRTGFTRWLAADGCAAAPDTQAKDSAVPDGAITCSTWNSCRSGRALQLCLHDGDHSMIEPWFAASLRWAAARRGP